jgi:hypothetical protein
LISSFFEGFPGSVGLSRSGNTKFDNQINKVSNFENLIEDVKQHNPESLDWNCISNMPNLSLNFLERNFKHLVLKNVLTHNKIGSLHKNI